MQEKEEELYTKRTQRDYSLSFNLQVVTEVESEELSIKGALRKYGIQSHSTVLNWIRKLVLLTVKIFRTSHVLV